MEMITSVSNSRIKDILKLKETKHRKETQQFLLEGIHLIKDALQKGIVLTIIGNESGLEHFKDGLHLIKEVILISDNVADKLSDVKSSQRVFAICAIEAQKIDFDHNVLLLDQIQDPGNIGTLIRSAAAFGFKTIVSSNDTVSYYNDKVLRSTQGNFFQVNLVNNYLSETIVLLKQAGYIIIGTHLHEDSEFLYKYKFKHNAKYALVIGNEAKGISPSVAEMLDDNIMIEMNSGVESLNAGVAGSIIMYKIQNN